MYIKYLPESEEPLNDFSQLYFEMVPGIISNHKDYIEVDKTLCRVIYASGYPRIVEPGFLDKIVTANGQFDISIHIDPQPLENLLIGLNRQLQKQRSDLSKTKILS